MSDIEQRLREAMDGVEEGLRLAEVGEYLYNECAYSYGDGRTEPREYGIEWQWQQAKPDEYGQGQLLAASTKWHAEQAADGIGTEATKLRDTIATLRKQVSEHKRLKNQLVLKAYPAMDAIEEIAPGFKSAVHFVRNVAMDMERDYPEICQAEKVFARTLAALREADHA